MVEEVMDVKCAIANMKIECETGEMSLDEAIKNERTHLHLDIKTSVEWHLDNQHLLRAHEVAALRLQPVQVIRESCIFLVGMVNQLLIHGPGTANAQVPAILVEPTVPNPNLEFRVYVHRVFTKRNLAFNQIAAIRDVDKGVCMDNLLFLLGFVRGMVDVNGIPGLGVTPAGPELQ